jgi:cell division protein FtsL
MRRAMQGAQNKLSQNLKETDPSGSKTDKLGKSISVNNSIQTRQNKISPLQESIQGWQKEIRDAQTLSTKEKLAIITDRTPKIQDAQSQIDALNKEIEELKAGTRQPD